MDRDAPRLGRDLVECVEQLCKELEEERGANKTLKLELEKLQDERDALKHKLDARHVPFSCSGEFLGANDEHFLVVKTQERKPDSLNLPPPRPPPAESSDN
jgi:septation ring formation regulator EzrA